MKVKRLLYTKKSRYMYTIFFIIKSEITYKGKVFDKQDPPSGESTTTVSWVNYQLHTCSYATEAAEFAAPICSRPQAAADHSVRDGRSN